MTNIAMRPARKEDARLGARLLMLSGPELVAISFNSTADGALRILTRLWPRSGHLYSYQWAYLAESDSQVVGILSGFTKEELHRASNAMFWAFTRSMWPWELVCMVANATDFSPLSAELGVNDFYVANVAVSPEARSQGVGHRLMELADRQASQRGCSRCALDVIIENTRAQLVYQDCGYRIVETRRSNRLAQRCGFSGMYRMVKDI